MNISSTTNVNPQATTQTSQQSKSTNIDLRNISQKEVNKLIRAGILELSANTLIIVSDSLNNEHGKDYVMNYRTDLIKQTENIIAYNKSIGISTADDEKALAEFHKVQGRDISVFSELINNESKNEINASEQNVSYEVSKSDVEKFLKDLTEKGALRFLAELSKEKIEEQAEKYRKELEEKYKDDPKMLAKIDELVEKFKKQLIEKMEEKIKKDVGDVTQKAEVAISVIKDMKPIVQNRYLEKILQTKNDTINPDEDKKNLVFKTSKLPFVELRYISEVLSCDKHHQHEELTITAIREGSINIETKNKTDLLKANSLSILNPSIIHRATLSDVVGSGCYVMYLEREWCEKIQSSLFDCFKDFVPVMDTFINDEILYKDFLSVCDKLLTEQVSHLEKEESLVSFISEVFLQFCTIKNLLEEDKKYPKLAYKIKHYIEENMDDDILLDDISQAVGISIVHTLRVFKKEFGLPIHSYLINKKVHLAKNLISRGMPISEVAQMSGFFDQSHLTKSFKRVFQLTPYEYQRNIVS